MTGLRFKTTCRIALVFFLIMFVLIAVLLAASLQAMFRAERHILKAVARGIHEELTAAGLPTESIPPRVIHGIDEKLAFIGNAREYAYAIVSPRREFLYGTPEFSSALPRRFAAPPPKRVLKLRHDDSPEFGVPRPRGLLDAAEPRLTLHDADAPEVQIDLDTDTLDASHRHLFLEGVRSGRRLDDLLSRWRFLYRYEGDGYLIFVSKERHFELVERLAHAALGAVLLAIALAVPAGYFLTRRLLAPVEAIGQTVERIKSGDLSARVPGGAGRDEISRLIERLNETFDRLDASFRQVSQFSADAAHELKTPLTALRGSLEVCLARDRAPDEYQIVLAESIEEVAALSRIVDDLLLLARPDYADPQRIFVPVDLAHVARDTTERLDVLAQERGVRIQLRAPGPCWVAGIESLLQRLCCNLLHNAVKFSPHGATVTVAVAIAGTDVTLAVTDQGNGIPPDEQPRVFDRFYQVDRSRSSGGTGLGLALAKWIAERHRGAIRVDSAPGKGSTFRVTLPSGAAPTRAPR
jgi:heavy metal sensor kinase